MSPRSFRIIVPTLLVSFAISACGGPATNQTAVAPTNSAVEQATARPTSTARPTQVPTAEPEPTAIPKPTTAPTPKPELSGKLEVTNLSYYKEDTTFHVVGLVTNGTEEGVTGLELTLTAKDAAGATLLKDYSDVPIESETFYPVFSTLASGESVPFEETFESDATDLNDYAVTIATFENTEVERPYVEVKREFVRAGYEYVVGELVNHSDQPVRVDSLAATIANETGDIKGIAYFPVFCGYLAPAGDPSGMDRAPFVAAPNNSDPSTTTGEVYLNASVTSQEPYDLALSDDVHTYVDADNNYHILGTVTNNESDALEVDVFGGVYDANGVVIDAGRIDPSITSLAPGESAPYDVVVGSSLFGIDMDAEMVGQIAQWGVQVCHSTTTSATEGVALKTSGVATEAYGTSVDVTGEILNSSDADLDTADVTVAAYDAKGNLVAVARQGDIEASDDKERIAPGDAVPFDVTLYLEEGVDADDLEIKTFALGFAE